MLPEGKDVQTMVPRAVISASRHPVRRPALPTDRQLHDAAANDWHGRTASPVLHLGRYECWRGSAVMPADESLPLSRVELELSMGVRTPLHARAVPPHPACAILRTRGGDGTSQRPHDAASRRSQPAWSVAHVTFARNQAGFSSISRSFAAAAVDVQTNPRTAPPCTRRGQRVERARPGARASRSQPAPGATPAT